MDPEVAGGLEGEVGITPARLPDEAQVPKLQGVGVEPGHGGEHIRHPGKLSLPHQPIPGEIEFDLLLPGRVPPVREFGEDLGIRVPGQIGRHPPTPRSRAVARDSRFWMDTTNSIDSILS